jgi:hypothetical protein
MADISLRVIIALRNTIKHLKSGAPYQWGHMGACNCGNLAQVVTRLTKAEIHAYAMQKHGDWNEQLNEYCPGSGLPVDLMIGELVGAGFTLQDLMHLERLSDPSVLAGVSPEKRSCLRKNDKQDLILYLGSWVRQLEERWVKNQQKTGQVKNEKINSHSVLA